MFDIEHGDRLADTATKAVSGNKVISISAENLLRLATSAKAAAAAYVQEWHQREVKKLMEEAMTVNFLCKPFRKLLGIKDLSEKRAQQIAEERIKNYPSWLRCWEVDDALRLAEKWVAIAEKLSYLESFDIKVRDFNTLRDWAAKA